MRPAVLLLILVTASLDAHETITTRLTWTAEISRIFERRCLGCHREGGQAPMAFTTYAEARPWAVAIREEVLERRMPPWNAVKGFGNLTENSGLSQEEIQRIAEWVTGGAPEGDPQYLKPLRPTAPVDNSTRATGMLVRDNFVLNSMTRVAGILPVSVRAGAAVKVTAHRPDGEVVALLWLLNYRSEWNRAYMYQTGIELPKGTRIRVHPPEAASFRLLR